MDNIKAKTQKILEGEFKLIEGKKASNKYERAVAQIAGFVNKAAGKNIAKAFNFADGIDYQVEINIDTKDKSKISQLENEVRRLLAEAGASNPDEFSLQHKSEILWFVERHIPRDDSVENSSGLVKPFIGMVEYKSDKIQPSEYDDIVDKIVDPVTNLFRRGSYIKISFMSALADLDSDDPEENWPSNPVVGRRDPRETQ